MQRDSASLRFSNILIILQAGARDQENGNSKLDAFSSRLEILRKMVLSMDRSIYAKIAWQACASK